MKLIFIIPRACTAYSGGVPVQGRMWKEGLEQNGDVVDLFSVWGKYDWNSYDYIVFLGYGNELLNYVNQLKDYPHPKLAIAPIEDFPGSVKQYKFRAKYFGSVKFKVNRMLHDFYYCRNHFDLFLVRSEHEKSYLVRGLGINPDKIEVIPLSIRFNENIPAVNLHDKENVCLHISRLAFWGKNVERLVQAAKKYKFELRLAGSLFGEGEKQWLTKLITDAPNIKYLGYLSDTELKEQYKRAKVFALPSIVEGVGFVALEAAVYGAEIVLTNIGAPKEYYDGRAYLVSPYSIDEIGTAICEAMNNGKSQPELQEHIIKNYSFDILSKKLHDRLDLRFQEYPDL